MTEKRFKLEDIGFVYDNGTLIGMYEIVDCLNALHEENQKLLTLSNMKKGALVEAVKELTEENEQLKKEMGDLGTAHAEEINKIENEFDEEILKLEKENELMEKTLDNISGNLTEYRNKWVEI